MLSVVEGLGKYILVKIINDWRTLLKNSNALNAVKYYE